MDDSFAHLHGIVDWPTPIDRMTEILRAGGLHVIQGRYSIRVSDCSHFIFQQYGGDLGEPMIEADAETVERMVSDAELVSRALEKFSVYHSFEIYDGHNNLARTITCGSKKTDS